MTDRDQKELSGAAGINRRGLLKCMSWAGTGVLWTLSGGVPRSLGLLGEAAAAETQAGSLTFLQISDSHVGFDKPANPNALGTFQEAIAKINAMPTQPAFIIHTGDISHLSKDKEFDDADQSMKALKPPVHVIPGEHDVADADNGKLYLDRYGKGTQGKGWYTFDVGGVHFIALINVFNFEPGFKSAGLAKLGDEQLEWMEKDLAGRSASTPIVVLAHLPLVDDLPGLGVGHRGCAPRPRLSETLRLGDRAQRPHPSDPAKGRGQRLVLHRALNGVSAAGARQRTRPRADEGPRRAIALGPRRADSQLCARQEPARHH